MSGLAGVPSGVLGVQGRESSLWDGFVSCTFGLRRRLLFSFSYPSPRSHWLEEPRQRPIVGKSAMYDTLFLVYLAFYTYVLVGKSGATKSLLDIRIASQGRDGWIQTFWLGSGGTSHPLAG